MPTITFIGAGSTVFARQLLVDILSYPELATATIRLHDIDAERLATSATVAGHAAAQLGAHPSVTTTTDRRAALDGADYVITMFQIGGYEPATVTDFEVPAAHGLRQTIADTLGVGGMMRGLRTIPVLLALAAEMAELCPDALLLNYVNPMAINCWALSRATAVRAVGLCHSVQGTARQLAEALGLPPEEIDYRAAGINHMAFYLTLAHDGQDLYPPLKRLAADGRVPDWDRVRYDILQRLGYFVTESSIHFAEYVPWFIKRDRPDLLDKYNIRLDEYRRVSEAQIAVWNFFKSEMEAGHFDHPFLQAERSEEYAARIIHSIETNTPRVIYGNVPNTGLITNLPTGCCVEVPCLVDANGLQPTYVGPLPPQLAALIQTNVNVQALTVEAALTGRRDHIVHAALLDPHTAAELDPDQIVALVDDLIAAHGDWLPPFT